MGNFEVFRFTDQKRLVLQLQMWIKGPKLHIVEPTVTLT